MKVTLAAIRRKYPHPRASHKSNSLPESYCVGGALCKFVGIASRDSECFPSNESIREAWAKAMKIDWYTLRDKDRNEVRGIIGMLIGSNDAGRFKAAWMRLGKLLSWKPTHR